MKGKLFEVLFRPPSEALVSRVGNYLVLCLAYLAGIFHWAWLINYGRVSVKYFDWQKFFDYYGVIKKALAVPFLTLCLIQISYLISLIALLVFVAGYIYFYRKPV